MTGLKSAVPADWLLQNRASSLVKTADSFGDTRNSCTQAVQFAEWNFMGRAAPQGARVARMRGCLLAMMFALGPMSGCFNCRVPLNCPPYDPEQYGQGPRVPYYVTRSYYGKPEFYRGPQSYNLAPPGQSGSCGNIVYNSAPVATGPAGFPPDISAWQPPPNAMAQPPAFVR